MSGLRHLSSGFVKLLNQFTVNDINVKTLRRLPKLCHNYSTVSPTEAPIISPEVMDTSRESLPLVINRELQYMDNINPKVTPIREVWLENMSSVESLKLSIVTLHPYIWGAFPRVDLIQECHKWQTLYKKIDWTWMPTREELSGNNRKPWPQKGTGRARARGKRAPQWKHGGWCHGPRGPKTYFYILPFPKRVKGLISMLSSKLAQNDLKVVDNLDIPSDKSKYIEDLCEERGWGPSVLFVDTSDLFPENISIATNDINHINLMPVYGLNVFSMLKHETLVLTLDAVEDIESKLLFQLRRTDLMDVMKSYRTTGDINKN